MRDWEVAVEPEQARVAFGCVRAWEMAVKLGLRSWEVAGNSGYAGVASDARAGLATPILFSRGRPAMSQGDRGTWESRLGRLGLTAGVDEGGG